MPKKFQGENSKAAAARARASTTKEEKIAQKQKELEDLLWKDDDKHVLRKQQRKEEQERKKQEQSTKKAQTKSLLEQEQFSLKGVNKLAPSPAPLQKVTRAQISETLTKPQPANKEKEKVETHLDVPLEENLNRLVIEGEEARTVDEAIEVLGKPEVADKHPEKRMKAAYTAYEKRKLQELQHENPYLRLSQLKQIIFADWQKSPENPLNKKV